MADCKDKDAATVIAGLDADKLPGTIKTSSNDPADMAGTIRGGIAQGTAYIVTDAIVDNGRIDLVVDTVAHHNRELASQQIPAMCEAAGKQATRTGSRCRCSRIIAAWCSPTIRTGPTRSKRILPMRSELWPGGADYLYRYPDRPEHRGERHQLVPSIRTRPPRLSRCGRGRSCMPPSTCRGNPAGYAGAVEMSGA